MSEVKYRHRFDPITNKCSLCGVTKRTIPFVGDGYNRTIYMRFKTEYSSDGINFSNEFINCKPKNKQNHAINKNNKN